MSGKSLQSILEQIIGPRLAKQVRKFLGGRTIRIRKKNNKINVRFLNKKHWAHTTAVKEVGKILGCSPRYVYKLRKQYPQ